MEVIKQNDFDFILNSEINKERIRVIFIFVKDKDAVNIINEFEYEMRKGDIAPEIQSLSYDIMCLETRLSCSWYFFNEGPAKGLMTTWDNVPDIRVKLEKEYRALVHKTNNFIYQYNKIVDLILETKSNNNKTQN